VSEAAVCRRPLSPNFNNLRRFAWALSLVRAVPAPDVCFSTGAPGCLLLCHHARSFAGSDDRSYADRCSGGGQTDILDRSKLQDLPEHPYEPIIPKEKFKIASEDAFDRGTVALAVLFAGEAQLTNSTPAFGQGVKGYAQYLGTAYGDLVIGDMMTEAIFPVMLHQDPRYFRRGTGTVWSRLGSAAGQIFWTRTDSGNTQFNYSEIIGN
jgi:hypothetical protein